MILAMVLEAAVMWALRWAFSPVGVKPDNAATNDNEPVADYDRVRDELELIADLMDHGRIHEASAELYRLCDLMDGNDEAAKADERWIRQQQQRQTA